MRKPISLLIGAILFAPSAKSQLLTTLPGSDIFITAGTPFVVENITLVPTANFVLSNNTLSKNAAVSFANGHPYILRVYKFAGSTNPYSGSLQINYTDGAELNGIAETELTLNNHTGSQWAAHLPLTRDNTNNFVLTSGLSNIVLNEFTLASVLSPLPLSTLRFHASVTGRSVLLQWDHPESAAIRLYQLQHSSDGQQWATLSVHRGGSSTRAYQYVHQQPGPGVHYYRLQMETNDNLTSYSALRKIVLSPDSMPFEIAGNPVTKGWLQLTVHRKTEIVFLSTSGQLIWRKQFQPGRFIIDVQTLSKGTYWLSAIDQTLAISIQ